MKKQWGIMLCIMAVGLQCMGCGEIEQTDTLQETESIEYFSEQETAPLAEQTQEENRDELAAKSKRSYADVLTALDCGDFEYGQMTLEMNDTGYYLLENQKFALADVDQDGMDELLVYIVEAASAGMQVQVFDYDEESNRAVAIGNPMFPMITIYDNGVICSKYSHNQGLGETLWPYNVYKIDQTTHNLIYYASVDSWEKSYMPKDYQGNAFPDALDTDQTGILYNITYADGSGQGDYLSASDFAAFEQELFGSAKQITPKMYDFDYDTMYTVLCADYRAYLTEKLKTLPIEEGELDLASLYIQSAFTDSYDVQSVLDTLSEYVELTPDNEEDPIVYTGTVDQREVFRLIYLDATSMSLVDSCDSLRLFGAKIGDPMEQMEERLEAFGFYQETEYTTDNQVIYINGFACDSFQIYVTCNEQNAIEKIGINRYSRYAG